MQLGHIPFILYHIDRYNRMFFFLYILSAGKDGINISNQLIFLIYILNSDFIWLRIFFWLKPIHYFVMNRWNELENWTKIETEMTLKSHVVVYLLKPSNRNRSSRFWKTNYPELMLKRRNTLSFFLLKLRQKGQLLSRICTWILREFF